MLAALLSSLTLLCVVIVIVSLLYERRTYIAPVPTLPWISRAVIALLKQHVSSDASLHIAELGSGWGGLSFLLARRFPHAKVTGYELSPFPYWSSRLRKLFSRRTVQFSRKDFFAADLASYNVLVCYLSPTLMQRLKPQFEADLKPGMLVISNAFPIPEWTPIDTTTVRVFMKIPVYVYRV